MEVILYLFSFLFSDRLFGASYTRESRHARGMCCWKSPRVMKKCKTGMAQYFTAEVHVLDALRKHSPETKGQLYSPSVLTVSKTVEESSSETSVTN
jgi:hypothetical protein